CRLGHHRLLQKPRKEFLLVAKTSGEVALFEIPNPAHVRQRRNNYIKTTTAPRRNSMNRSHLRHGFFLIPLMLACFALSPVTQAAPSPKPGPTPNGDLGNGKRIIAQPQRNGLAANQIRLAANGCDSGAGSRRDP